MFGPSAGGGNAGLHIIGVRANALAASPGHGRSASLHLGAARLNGNGDSYYWHNQSKSGGPLVVGAASLATAGLTSLRLLYSGAMSDSDIGRMITYLASKWGISF